MSNILQQFTKESSCVGPIFADVSNSSLKRNTFVFGLVHVYCDFVSTNYKLKNFEFEHLVEQLFVFLFRDPKHAFPRSCLPNIFTGSLDVRWLMSFQPGEVPSLGDPKLYATFSKTVKLAVWNFFLLLFTLKIQKFHDGSGTCVLSTISY